MAKNNRLFAAFGANEWSSVDKNALDYIFISNFIVMAQTKQKWINWVEMSKQMWLQMWIKSGLKIASWAWEHVKRVSMENTFAKCCKHRAVHMRTNTWLRCDMFGKNCKLCLRAWERVKSKAVSEPTRLKVGCMQTGKVYWELQHFGQKQIDCSTLVRLQHFSER